MTPMMWVGIFTALIVAATLRRVHAIRRIQALRARGAVVVDVRTPMEFRGGHAEGALNLPMDQLADLAGKLDKSRPVLLCCASGARSASAARLLRKKGFEAFNAGPWTRLR